MGIIDKGIDIGVKVAKKSVAPAITASVVENYIKQMNKEGKKWSSVSNIAQYFGGTAVDRVMKIGNSIASAFDLKEPFSKDSMFNKEKAEGGMMNARKKGMGLKMANGGSALNSVPSDNTGLSKLPTPVRNKMGYMKKGGAVKKRAKSSSKKSRGTGAAIRGTKFKGVF